MMKKGSLLIQNCAAILPECIAHHTDILITDGIIAGIGRGLPSGAGVVYDAGGKYVFPGFIDVHVHGGGGADFMDGTPEAFETAANAHLTHGTTTLVPTAMTASKEELLRFLRACSVFRERSGYGGLVPGVHLEGPYLSGSDSKSKGAQKADRIRPIDFDEVNEILSAAKGWILRWDAAPEIPNSLRFAGLMAENGILCAAAHSDATGYEAEAGFHGGFSHVTHFYNAVTAYKKRDQLVTAGVVEAAYLNDSVTVELICDGKHVPEHCLKLALEISNYLPCFLPLPGNNHRPDSRSYCSFES